MDGNALSAIVAAGIASAGMDAHAGWVRPEIGIGSFFLSGAFSSYRSMDYTRSSLTTKGAAANIDARAYQVRHLEIWVEPAPSGMMLMVY